jgi:hypothetical protein
MRRTSSRWAAVALAALAVVVAGTIVVVAASDGAEPTVTPRTGEERALGFTNVAADVGLRFEHAAFRYSSTPDVAAMTGGGVCWIDYDDDGWLDLYVVNAYSEAARSTWLERGGLPTSRLFRNVRGRFTDVTASSGAGVAARGQGCVAADLDRDGRTDLLVTTFDYPRLLWNDGDGTFTEGARPAGMTTYGWYTGAAAGDLNGDRWPDVVLTGYVDLNEPRESATQAFPNTYGGRRDLLYLSEGRNGGRATFREVGAEAGLEVARFEYGLGVVLSDLDRDGDLDVYVANDTNPNRLYENVPWPGGIGADPFGIGFRFEERAGPAGVADPGSGMGIADADYDGDARADLFVTNARRQIHAAYRNNPPDEQQPTFADVRAVLGPNFSGSTGWGVSWGDVDLDTDLDLLVVNGSVPVLDPSRDAEYAQLFANLGADGRPGVFEDASGAAGLRGLGRLLARGSAAADFDNDGDLDVAVNWIGGPLVLLENTGTRGNWLEVQLDEFRPGAEVTVVLPGGRELVRQSQAGGSYLSSEDPRLHFGLGDATRASEVRVRWPGGRETRLNDVEANQIVVVDER